jgi:hypothetical protein
VPWHGACRQRQSRRSRDHRPTAGRFIEACRANAHDRFDRSELAAHTAAAAESSYGSIVGRNAQRVPTPDTTCRLLPTGAVRAAAAGGRVAHRLRPMRVGGRIAQTSRRKALCWRRSAHEATHEIRAGVVG